MESMSLAQMIWFPALFIAVVTLWLVLSIRGAMRRRYLSRHSPSVTVQLPDDSSIVRNDGHNLDN